MKTEPVGRSIQYGARRIDYRLHRGRRRSIRIVVSPDLSVNVYAPSAAPEQDAVTFVRRKLPWIAKTLDKVAACRRLAFPREYVSGETLVYLGSEYQLKIEKGPECPPRLVGGFLCVSAQDCSSRERVREMVEGWRRERAEEIVHECWERCRRIAAQHEIPETTWSLRTMKSRWGSCSRKGRITLNTRLVQVPVACIEYVIMHEMCHAKEHNHGSAFYALLARCMPDWRERKGLLSRMALQ